MKIVVLAVGKLRSDPLRELCADYLKRMQRFGGAEIRELKASTAVTAEEQNAQESNRIIEALEPSDAVMVLDERGAMLSSVELSQTLKNHELRGTKRLVCVIGGAYGLNATVRERGKVWSLSKLTFPHELCRAIVLEQLYRARTIQHNQPYHHA